MECAMSDKFKAELARATGKTESEEKSQTRYTMRKKDKETSKNAAVSIKDNPFAKIVEAYPNPEDQKAAMVELMTFVDAETTKKNNKYLEEYGAYMQSDRQRLAVELIKMTDTKTFSNMQKVLRDINDGVLDFEEQIQPFMEIINAVRLIQAEDATTDIIAEMREDEKRRAEMDKKLAAISRDLEMLRSSVKGKLVQIEKLKEDRRFLGLGDIKQSAKDRIAVLNVEISQLKSDESDLLNKQNELRASYKETESKFENLKEAKEIMASMLNLSEGDHEERHKKLVDTAAEFVNTTKERVSETLDRSVQMGDQIKSLSDLAFTMRSRYTVLSEAAKDAEKINSEKHEALKAEMENDGGGLGRIQKEEESRALAKHITILNDAATETTNVISDLTTSSQRIENMEAANIKQIKKTQQIQTSGIAGVADNLSSVLTAINQAAIGQASTAAQQSLRRMNTNTINLTKEQMLNMAKERNDDNSALIKMLEEMAGYGEVIQLANESAQEAIGENREILKDMRRVADEVQGAAKDTLELTSNQITSEINDDEER
tara:strand:+ start:22660 stop:24300 length:1641 start_codon:yes stop_codon:yes gene_type:complete